MQPGVITAYVKGLFSARVLVFELTFRYAALNVVYIIGVPAGILASLAGMLTRNVSVKGKDMMAGGA